MTGKVVEMGNVIIQPKDQSAPKKHWADEEIMKAAAEIDAGNFIPDPQQIEGREQLEAMGLALGPRPEGGKPSLEDFRRTHDELMTIDLLGRHPRVIEAIDRMRQEIREAPGHEAIEKTCMLWEMAEARTHGKVTDEKEKRMIDEGRIPAPHDQRLPEQTKLASDEYLESRKGEILSPEQFYDRLGKVTGKGKLKLSPHVVLPHPGARSGRVGLYIRNPNWKGDAQIYDTRPAQAQQLRETGLAELARARRLRKLGLHSEADKAFSLAADMAQAATEIYLTLQGEAQLKEPELLRVASLQWPCSTEWMVCAFNEFGVVTHAKYLGWRTALLMMIRNRTITEKQAHKAFPVGSGPAANWYMQQLMEWRNSTGIIQ
jgi:hypothetical protein